MPPPRKIILIVEDQILLAMELRDELEDGGYQLLKLAVRPGLCPGDQA